MKQEHGLDKVDYFAPPSKAIKMKDRNALNKLLMIGLIIVFIILVFVLFIYPGYFTDLFSNIGSTIVN